MVDESSPRASWHHDDMNHHELALDMLEAVTVLVVRIRSSIKRMCSEIGDYV